ncbi:hypothetical protein BpHYR1_044319 [Brachionus plicatilis]|uniref:Uncharacterized protein n=1 Tax=Brachionus plicatilis TaxID=10195 RepID=A0A3M7T6H6_BRAPC|nr:hypothetical protein BpHYR1_044319 [Brachionus plicatilis]
MASSFQLFSKIKILNKRKYRNIVLTTLRIKLKSNLFSFRVNYIVSIVNFEIGNNGSNLKSSIKQGRYVLRDIYRIPERKIAKMLLEYKSKENFFVKGLGMSVTFFFYFKNPEPK